MTAAGALGSGAEGPAVMGSGALESGAVDPGAMGRAVRQRGSATLLVAAGLLVASGIVAALLMFSWCRIETHRVQGAADLAALTGARAMSNGAQACEASGRAAAAERTRLASCSVVGDELDFVVSVSVEDSDTGFLLGIPTHFGANSNAGVLQDVP